jgi:hypothetical protein
MRIFGLTAITGGLACGLLAWLEQGEVAFGLAVGLTCGIVGGAFLALTFAVASRYYRRKYNTNSVLHMQVLTARSAPTDTYAASMSALQELGGCKILSSDSSAGAIHVRTQPTWKSWGEEMHIEIATGNEGGSIIAVASRPALKTTSLDLGKNHENVDKFRELLNKRVNVKVESTKID